IPDDWLGRVRLHSADGEAGEAIVRSARQLGVRAIVLSSHGETRNLAEPAGRVALDVLRDPPCPVYILPSTVPLHAQERRLRHLRRILTPLDGTAEANQAVGYAAEAAVRAHARLLMLHVVDEDPSAARVRATPRYSDQSHHELEAWRTEFQRRGFASTHRPKALRSEAVLRVGDPATVIADYANEQDCDLIVSAWGGSLSPGRAKVVRALLSRARCPLLFLRAESA
ncbi:MAG TPA: universal stress protein, partial [Dehalococcoidia bacterium]|nr:universal stress protein [Dehalococcoidia bacterium]